MTRLIPFAFLFFTLCISNASAQQLPLFLNGTWKLENKDIFEHWDVINANSLKGFSYKMTNGQMEVNEYLEINRRGEEIMYTATVINQNQGIGIDFTLTQSDNLFSFENPNHDFPKFIRYRLVSENKLQADVGTHENSFTLIFQKVN